MLFQEIALPLQQHLLFRLIMEVVLVQPQALIQLRKKQPHIHLMDGMRAVHQGHPMQQLRHDSQLPIQHYMRAETHQPLLGIIVVSLFLRPQRHQIHILMVDIRLLLAALLLVAVGPHILQLLRRHYMPIIFLLPLPRRKLLAFI